ncbi:GFA family protein [Marinicella sp. S1101]|uniref:GFA family protein n=1 Tax=Marinicella marina TaxID=2996016 RepID=UPI002260B6BF|nr:GFA family protein [Marinicella marina]MCX7554518.1 GFA family protein [Marinicella marina]MDJ1140669.1 GFA family protein [Marinicella marina]
MYQGSCLCGAIKFSIEGSLGRADACHCVQCRKWTGHFLPSVEVKRSALVMQSKATLKWYHSSEKVRRGFCGQCGSSLFFDPTDQVKHDWLGVAMGAFDSDTKKQLELHIFVAEKGSYYEINDGVPQNEH